MRLALFSLLALMAGSPALAQHEGHGTQTAPPPQPDPHAGHEMPDAEADPHAGHVMQEPASDPHAGHDMTSQTPASDPHAGHVMPMAAPPAAAPPAEAGSGPDNAADAWFDPAEMARARESLASEHGASKTYRFMIDQLEVAVRDGHDSVAWEDVQFWYGGDRDKVWIKTQGEAVFGEGVESAEVQALWSHAIAPFFDLQAGVRYDIRPLPNRGYLVLGVQGLAPYWFEMDASAYLSEKGDVSARIEGEHDIRLTQRLILQPRAEMEFQFQDVPELRSGSGLSMAEAGLRLRYELVPEFAPYVGVNYERGFGDTADFRRADGENAGGWSFVAGVRAWF